MKKNNIVKLILIAITLCLPFTVYGLTEEERFAKLDEIPFTEIAGEKHLDLKMVDPDILIGDKCVFTIEGYNKVLQQDPGIALNYTSDQWINEQNKLCKTQKYEELIKLYLKSIGHDLDDNYQIMFNYENPSKNEVNIYYNDEEGNGSFYDVKISYVTEIDENIYKDNQKILDKFDKPYSSFGLELVNSIYHYGTSNQVYKKDIMLYRYAEIKQIIELNPNYKFVTRMLYGGGMPYEGIGNGLIGIIKNDILYNVKELVFYNYYILYVDEDETGTIYEKAQKRLKEYFNNKVNVTYDKQTANEYGGPADEYFNDLNNNVLKTTNKIYTGTHLEFTLDEVNVDLVIIEVPKDKLDMVKVRSVDYATGINVETNSYDVPIDARIKVADVKMSEYVSAALDKENLVVDEAYDITLSKAYDGTLIRTIENGVEVYLPVDETYKENDKVKVYYIKTDSTIGETIEGTIVKINNKLYVKFVTNHFSTYALASEKEVEKEIIPIENPATGDNIIIPILLGSVSIISLIGILIISKKKKINK